MRQHETTYTYNAFGQPLTVTTPAGRHGAGDTPRQGPALGNLGEASRGGGNTGTGIWYAVSAVAKYLQRDQANISTMLSRLSARQTERG